MLIFLFIFFLPFISVSGFSWKSCGDKNDVIKVISLTKNSGNGNLLYFSGRAKVAFNLTSPIQGKLEVKKKFFWGWTVIPCVHQFGSCTYNDLCSLSPFINDDKCPEKFLNNSLPCKCPIPQGQYTGKNFEIDLRQLPHWIESGTYNIKMVLSKAGQKLLCMIMNINL